MEVGDSFIVPLTGTADDFNGKAYTRFATLAHVAGKRSRRKFALRFTGEGLVTCWRED